VLVRTIVEVAIIAAAVVIGLQLRDAIRSDDGDEPPLAEEESRSAFDESVAPLERIGLREGPPVSGGHAPPERVVVLDLWPGRTERLADVAPGVEVVVVANEEEAASRLADADALLGALSPTLLEAGRDLRWVQIPAAGIERYARMPGLADRDIVVTNAQRIFAPGGAEHVLALVLALARRLPVSLELQRQRRWDAHAVTGPSPYVGDGSELLELRGRTLLVAGLGGIGTETARLAAGIGMRVTATRNSSREGPAFVSYVGSPDELTDLAAEADVIVNALPFTAETDDAFDAAVFDAMKPGALFVNVGRGGTVDTEALVRALREGGLGGAGLDVTDPEPLPPEHELWGMSNVIITPHIGGDSDRHQERMFLLFQENLRRFAAGEPLLSVVDLRRGY
jgi:phosphoglycerate dehydrogenase-like enzyme